MQCPDCGWELLLAREGRDFCSSCGSFFPRKRLSAAVDAARQAGRVVRGQSLVALLRKLPSTLAIVVDEFLREPDDNQSLHRMGGALEITARFLTAVVVAQLWARRALAESAFPETLLKNLMQHLERPTLGSWKVLLGAAVDDLPSETGTKKGKQCLLSELPAYVLRFCDALGDGQAAG